MKEQTAKLIWKQERSLQQSEALKKAYKEGRLKTTFSKGHTVSDEWKEISRKANLGKSRHVKPHSEDTKKQISYSRKGKTGKDKNPNWKGGITLINKVERERFAREIRPLIFKRDDYTCQICFIKGQYMHVDHIKSWAEFEEFRFDLENCRTLCRKCHYKVTFNKELPDASTWGMDCKISNKISETI